MTFDLFLDNEQAVSDKVTQKNKAKMLYRSVVARPERFVS